MSGVLLRPENGRLVLPDGSLWVPPTGAPLDRVVPRVCLAPSSFAFSSGIEAIELAASAGLILDDWQQLNLMLGLGETVLGKWAAFIVALIVSRQNGKGSELEALELFWLFGTGEQLIGHSAHEYKTAMEAFRRVLFLIENNDWLRKKVKKVINTNGEEGIELLTGQRLRFMARSKGAGRGFTFHKLVWDEAYALTREQQDAQLPTMSAVPNPQIWIMSSPPLSSDTGAVLFQLRKTAAAYGVQLVFMDYGNAGSLDRIEEMDLDDESAWLNPNPAEVSGRITLETMRRERIAMGDVGFARERLGIWPPDLTQGFGVITKEQWDRMLDARSGSDQWQDKDFPAPNTPMSTLVAMLPPTQLVGRPTIAISVSPRNNGIVRSSIGLASYREDKKRHIELVATGTGTAWVIPAVLKIVTGSALIAGIAVDPGAPEGSLLADLESALKPNGEAEPIVPIIKMTSRDVASAFGILYDAANEEDPTVVHLGQAELVLSVGGAVTRPVGADGLTWDSRNSVTEITSLKSVTHAVWALAQADQEAEPEPLVIWA